VLDWVAAELKSRRYWAVSARMLGAVVAVGVLVPGNYASRVQCGELLGGARPLLA
jgi:hypothetical protein